MFHLSTTAGFSSFRFFWSSADKTLLLSRSISFSSSPSSSLIFTVDNDVVDVERLVDGGVEVSDGFIVSGNFKTGNGIGIGMGIGTGIKNGTWTIVVGGGIPKNCERPNMGNEDDDGALNFCCCCCCCCCCGCCCCEGGRRRFGIEPELLKSNVCGAGVNGGIVRDVVVVSLFGEVVVVVDGCGGFGGVVLFELLLGRLELNGEVADAIGRFTENFL
jgi:hypothetical protein